MGAPRSTPGESDDDRAPDWLLPPDDGSLGDELPPLNDLGLSDDGELTYRGEVVPHNDWREVVCQVKRETAQKLPSSFARTKPRLPRLRLQPHRRHREQRPRARCSDRASPDAGEGGDGEGPPCDLTTPPTFVDLLTRLEPLVGADVLAAALGRWLR